MKFLTSLYDRANLFALRFLVGSGVLAMPGFAHAQPSGAGTDTVNRMVTSICGIISPLTGQSKVLSLVFLIALGVMVFLWWMSENKEGVLVWVLRTGLALAVLINLVTLPGLVGLPPVCSGN